MPTALTTYLPSPIARYAGNPLIEVLPKPLTNELIYRRFTHLPIIRAEELSLPSEERRFAINGLFSFRQSLPNHAKLGLMLDELIREGYVGRNPLRPSTRTHTHFCITGGSDGVPSPTPDQLTAKTAFVTGISRQGKTCGILRVLSTNFQQKIQHTNYGGHPLAEIQVVWLYVRVPANASLRDFAMAFFEALDRAAFGPDATVYQDQAGKMVGNVGRLITLYRKVARQYHIGVIVVDELQFLSIGRARGHDELRKFLHELVDSIGIPIMFCGTYKAYEILLKTLHETGRIVGLGKIDFAPPTADSRVWRLFVESLWRCNWLREQKPLTDPVITLMHDLVQGITDFAVRLYVIAQMKALAIGKECVNEEILRSVMANELSPLKPALDALRTGSEKKLRNYEDLLPGASVLNSLVTSASDSLFAERLSDMVRKEIDKLLPSYMTQTEKHPEPEPAAAAKKADEDDRTSEIRSMPEMGQTTNTATTAHEIDLDLRDATKADDPLAVLEKFGVLDADILETMHRGTKTKAKVMP